MSRASATPFWASIVVAYAAFVGLRDNIGADWEAYQAIFDYVSTISILDALTYNDPAYSLINWFASRANLTVHAVNVVSAAVFIISLVSFCRHQTYPILAFTISVPIVIVMIGMGYTRQAAALGLGMIAIARLAEGRSTSFLVWIVAAATFHQSALLLVPLVVLAADSGRLWKGLAILAFLILVYFSWADARFDVYATRYFGRPQNDSEGAFVRVLMSAIPATIYLTFLRRRENDHRVRRLWTWVSIGAVSLMVAVALWPSAIIIDRFAIYFIPIQLHAYTQLMERWSLARAFSTVYASGLILGYGAVLWVWLSTGQHAPAWVPYHSALAF